MPGPRRLRGRDPPVTLLDTATAAAALGVTERTVRRWVVAGKIANHGTARAIRIALADVMGTVTVS